MSFTEANFENAIKDKMCIFDQNKEYQNDYK